MGVRGRHGTCLHRTAPLPRGQDHQHQGEGPPVLMHGVQQRRNKEHEQRQSGDDAGLEHQAPIQP